MKKKIFKSLAVVACALLLVVGSVVGTFAYLTSQAEVTNTFTVGNVKITMDETDVDLYGDKESDTRVNGNEYKLIPGHTYTKDPTIYIDDESEACWIFVKIENGLAAIEVKADDGDTIIEQLGADWTEVATNVYAYKETKSAGTKVTPFTTFTLAGDADLDGTPDYTKETIKITAYAVQADGFDTAQAAWTATFGKPANNN